MRFGVPRGDSRVVWLGDLCALEAGSARVQGRLRGCVLRRVARIGQVRHCREFAITTFSHCHAKIGVAVYVQFVVPESGGSSIRWRLCYQSSMSHGCGFRLKFLSKWSRAVTLFNVAVVM